MSTGEVPGESAAYFWAGVLALTGAFVVIYAIWAAYKRKPYVWQLGFISAVLASFATALGLWKLAGESGWGFLGLAVCLFIVAVTLAVMWERKWPITPFQKLHIETQKKDETDGDRSGPRPQ